MRTRNISADIKAALENPLDTLVGIYGEQLGSGLYRLAESGIYLTGAEETETADNPTGFLGRVDAIDTVPGARGLTRDGQSVNEIWNEMQAMLAAFNRSNDAIVSLLSFPTISQSEQIGVPVNPGFQVATEFGRPGKVRVRRVARAFPLDHYDLGDGYTQEYIDDAVGAELLAVQSTIVNSWTTLLRELSMDALFGNANYTDKDALAIKRLYNADGEVPPTIKRWTHTGSHNHYLNNGGGGFDEADLDTMSLDLIHHGFREFGDSAFILHVHRTDLPTIRGFTNFIPADSSEVPRILADSGQVVGATRAAQAGLRVEGYVNDWTVVQNNDMVSGYLLGMVSGGPLDTRNVLGFRQHENASARGLRLVEGVRQNYPLYDSVYDGYAGFGVAQRGAAVIMQDAASYTAPTFSTGD